MTGILLAAVVAVIFFSARSPRGETHLLVLCNGAAKVVSSIINQPRG